MKKFFVAISIIQLAWPVVAVETLPSMRPYQSAFVREVENSFFVILKETAELEPAYQLKSKEARGRFVYETLRATAERSQADIRAWLLQNSIWHKSYWIQNMILVRADDTVRDILSVHPGVASIRSERFFQAIDPDTWLNARDLPASRGIEWNISQIRADAVWQEFGVKGDGIVICDNDTGVDWEHPALINQYRGWDGENADHNYNWFDSTGTSPFVPIDDNSHGTHTTGTIVGFDGDSNQIGVAPSAQWIGVKCMNNEGSGQDSWFHDSFQWILAPTDLDGENPDPTKAPHVVNNSWGYMGGDRVFEPDVEALVAAGIFIEVSAGNEGPGCGTLRSPGDYESSFTTGSTNQGGLISDFSSRGPSALYPDITKPEVVAPGANVRSCVPGGGYQSFSGTSMAGPHSVGIVALLWSANPDLIGDIDATRDVIQQTAVFSSVNDCDPPLRGYPNNVYGWGEIDCLAAVGDVFPPQSWGVLQLNKTAFMCNDILSIIVKDSDIAGTGTLPVTISSTTETAEPEQLLLEEGEPGIFSGSIAIEEGSAVAGDGILQVTEFDDVTVTYEDSDFGGSGPETVTKSAVVDCTAPVVQTIETGRLTSTTADITWETDTPSTTGIWYGDTAPPENAIVLGRYNTEHSVTITNLESCTDYLFMIEAVDEAGNTVWDDNDGNYYSFKTFRNVVGLWENMDNDPGWLIEGDWEWGLPGGNDGDPTSGYTGAHVYGYNLDGAYDHGQPKFSLVSPALDLTDATSTTISFAMWLGVGGYPDDQASWDVSLDDGSTWFVLFDNSMFGGPLQMNFWLPLDINLGDFIDGYSAVRFRWTMGPTGNSGVFSGWNLDDIKISYDIDCDQPTPTPRPTFTPSPTPTVTPSPTPSHPLGVRIDIPEMVHPGDEFSIIGYLDNPDLPMTEVPTFFILEVYDVYWFWPSWGMYDPPDFTDIDFMRIDAPTGTTNVTVISPITWPDTGPDIVTGLWIYGAMLNEEMTEILGDMAAQEWGYGPKN
jgi:hypothetical protein